MLQRVLFNKPSLLSHTSSYSFTFIYLRDVDKKMNPKRSRIPYSYMDPRKSFEGVPRQEKWSSRLPKKVQENIDRKLFEEYKTKILMGTIDEEKKVNKLLNVERTGSIVGRTSNASTFLSEVEPCAAKNSLSSSKSTIFQTLRCTLPPALPIKSTPLNINNKRIDSK